MRSVTVFFGVEYVTRSRLRRISVDSPAGIDPVTSNMRIGAAPEGGIVASLSIRAVQDAIRFGEATVSADVFRVNKNLRTSPKFVPGSHNEKEVGGNTVEVQGILF